MEGNLAMPHKTTYTLSFDPSVLLVGIYPEIHLYQYVNTHAKSYAFTALFVKAEETE